MDMLSVSEWTVTIMSVGQELLIVLLCLILVILLTPGFLDLLSPYQSGTSVKKPVKNTLIPLESTKEKNVKLPLSSKEEL